MPILPSINNPFVGAVSPEIFVYVVPIIAPPATSSLLLVAVVPIPKLPDESITNIVFVGLAKSSIISK